MNHTGFINGNLNSIMSVLWGLKRAFIDDTSNRKKIIIEIENFSGDSTSPVSKTPNNDVTSCSDTTESSSSSEILNKTDGSISESSEIFRPKNVIKASSSSSSEAYSSLESSSSSVESSSSEVIESHKKSTSVKEVMRKESIENIMKLEAEIIKKDKLLQHQTEQIQELENTLHNMNHELKKKDKHISKLMKANSDLKKTLKAAKKNKKAHEPIEIEPILPDIEPEPVLPEVDNIDKPLVNMDPEERDKCIIVLQIHMKKYLAGRRIKKHTIKYLTAQEVVSTEQTYVDNLQKMLDLFYEPLKLLLDTSILNTIFLKSELDVIIGFNNIFQMHINKFINDDMNYFTPISNSFIQMAKFMKIYTVYTNNYTKSMDSLMYQKKNDSTFSEFIDDMDSNGENISSYLVLPIQRPPRYVMLLKTLLENTPKDHEDYGNLENVLNIVSDVANYINEKKRETEEIHEVINVKNKLEGNEVDIDRLLSVPSRSFVGEGPAVCGIRTLDPKKCYIFLFNDLILITTKKKKKEIYRYIDEYPLTSRTSMNIEHEYISIHNPRTIGRPLITDDVEGINIFIQTEEEEEFWADLVYGAIQQLKEAKQSRSTAREESGIIYVGKDASPVQSIPIDKASRSNSDLKPPKSSRSSFRRMSSQHLKSKKQKKKRSSSKKMEKN
eukprot:TRINITY_DN3704_c0_g1_i1.p1 TRINITY_DN3704_c0_g1~~TRINITY_DN3704_c0_g1_i1.p1  ORF type:complete len:775 (+),score=171.93 TRINITY_DN3704_c0_g1_i1:322-2325(+)